MLGVAAVPGSGKTHTLSALTARLIAGGRLAAGQEILIVTLVNSAVENFTARLLVFSREMDLIPDLGYRVRTLHGLAHDIVRENPSLVGLEQQFAIVDEAAAAAMIRDAARSWTNAHPEAFAAFVKGEFGDDKMREIADRNWPELIESIAQRFIRAAKDSQLSPERLAGHLAAVQSDLLLARAGVEIYAAYQKGLRYRGAVDFDDLIRFAAQMLAQSNELLERLRFRWPIILEDEAQDSSALQQQILSTLAGPSGNWVRVGDPNQAIFETFTTADPRHLRDFISDNNNLPMPESGRCQPAIIGFANHLIEWSRTDHPVEELHSALSTPLIKPAPAGDPQPNPPDDPSGLQFMDVSMTPDEEIAAVVKSIKPWLDAHKSWTVAVLCSTNDHAAGMVRALQVAGIPCRELLRSSSPTRAVAGSLSHLLACLADPGSPARLSKAYRVWRRGWRDDPSQAQLVNSTAARLSRMRHLEDYLARQEPSGQGIPDSSRSSSGSGVDEAAADEAAAVEAELRSFKLVAERWHQASVLPIDQLILALAQDVFTLPEDLALAHKLALVMGQLASENRHWRLPELTPHLNQIASNKRKFIGFTSDDTGFEPDQHKGEVVVATLHKAKGLEWDRVYLISLNDYDFPSGIEGDVYFSEKWFIRDGLNLEAEALAQLELLRSGAESGYVEGAATASARLSTARERLRVLYVGITRARKELVFASNTGRRGEAHPAIPLNVLQAWWEGLHPAAAAASE